MMVPDAYRQFLERKVKTASSMGFDVAEDEVNPELKPFTRDTVRWMVRGGRRAVFASFGLHKTATQIEALRLIRTRVGGPTLTVLPLGVRQEFFREAAERFRGPFAVRLKFIRRAEEMEDGDVHYLTNYETIRDRKLNPNLFVAVSLDEASVLRSFGSKTYQEFLRMFDRVRFRFVATATPSPNRHKELIHYAAFLGIMDSGQSLTRWFKRDSKQANNLTLFPHKEQEFWLWCGSWAVFLQRPSDLGYSDVGYALPEMIVRWHEVQVNLSDAGIERDGQGLLFRDGAGSLVAEARERRGALPAVVAKVAEIRAAEPDNHFLLWHDLENERLAIEKAIPGVVSVYGTQELDAREQVIIDFSDGRIRDLAGKPVLVGSGCNFQHHCHRAIYAGVGHKFNDFIQSIHRIQRFGQTELVEIDIVYPETMRAARRDLEAKWARHNEMMGKMSELIRVYGLNADAMVQTLTRSIGVERIETSGEGWLVANNDCVDETRRMATDSVGLIVTSIPFSNHYEYTDKYNDFGHTDDNGHFWEQMDHLTPELLRVLQPGRLACIHVKDRILFGNVTGKGVPTVSPFHAEAIFHYMRHGFDYLGMHIILTDVVRENNQTYRLGYTEMCKDSTTKGQGCPEYLLVFRKPQTNRSKGYADERVSRDKPLCRDAAGEAVPYDEGFPIIPGTGYSLARWQIDAHAFWRSSGDRLLSVDELSKLGPDALAKLFTEQSLQTIYDFEAHVRIGEALAARGALPSSFMSLAPGSWSDAIWHDVNRMLTLNGEQSKRGLEMHVCPLQFDIVDRLIVRYSNPGDEVFDPFGGLMTVPYRALKLKRRGRASELHTGYLLDGVKYLQAMEREVSMPSLFDLMEAEAAPAKPKATPAARPAVRRRPTPPADSLLEVV